MGIASTEDYYFNGKYAETKGLPGLSRIGRGNAGANKWRYNELKCDSWR
jgi:hypothetical protein